MRRQPVAQSAAPARSPRQARLSAEQSKLLRFGAEAAQLEERIVLAQEAVAAHLVPSGSKGGQ